MRFRLITAASFLAVVVAAQAQFVKDRPRITGISHLAVYTSNAASTDHFYRDVMGAIRLPDPENPKGAVYAFNDVQFVEVLPLPPGQGVNRLDHIAFNTDDAEGLRQYLARKSWKVPLSVIKGDDSGAWFTVTDPEGNKVQFVQPRHLPIPVNSSKAIGHHIIHVGMLVRNRAYEDTFYRDLLGFRPYWWGGMKEGKVDWVSQQTPDGHDWLEYMLETGPAGSASAAQLTQHQLGVLDHVSIGVHSVDEAYKTLKDGGRLAGVQADNGTKIGRDGKGQFNMYDPDEIRIELMNFHATEKPCCSRFTAEDPTE
jgi:catechol 2,3-dioxygenase-like lactoylglutathione lyase family enzyme